jgi:hypothetical protein
MTKDDRIFRGKSKLTADYPRFILRKVSVYWGKSKSHV